jgi:hypothetical protein
MPLTLGLPWFPNKDNGKILLEFPNARVDRTEPYHKLP